MRSLSAAGGRTSPNSRSRFQWASKSGSPLAAFLDGSALTVMVNTSPPRVRISALSEPAHLREDLCRPAIQVAERENGRGAGFAHG